MEVPKNYRGMKKVKEYSNYVLYEKKIVDKWENENIIRDSFTYHDLGFTTKQIRDRKINAGLHL